MTPPDCWRVIEKLDDVIQESRSTLQAFIQTGLDEQLPGDREALQGIMSAALQSRRELTQHLVDLRSGRLVTESTDAEPSSILPWDAGNPIILRMLLPENPARVW